MTEWIREAQNGDDTAFEALYRELQPRLLRYLRVRSHDWADDVAAETWIDVVRHLPGFSGGGAQFRAWVFTIGRGKYVDRVRYEQRRPAVPTNELPGAVMAVVPDVAQSYAEESATLDAIDLIRTLPPHEAEVVALRVIAELDVAAVATLTGRTAVGVRVAAHRGLRRLAEQLRAQTAPAPGTTAPGPATATATP